MIICEKRNSLFYSVPRINQNFLFLVKANIGFLDGFLGNISRIDRP